jgi:hypothetical protein
VRPWNISVILAISKVPAPWRRNKIEFCHLCFRFLFLTIAPAYLLNCSAPLRSSLGSAYEPPVNRKMVQMWYFPVDQPIRSALDSRSKSLTALNPHRYRSFSVNLVELHFRAKPDQSGYLPFMFCTKFAHLARADCLSYFVSSFVSFFRRLMVKISHHHFSNTSVSQAKGSRTCKGLHVHKAPSLTTGF